MPQSDNPREVIGANNPPEPTPFEIAEKAVIDIWEECRLWLDGAPIESQEQADGVGNLLAEIRKAETLADDARKAEKADLDKQIAAIQARYAPLIGNTKTMKGKTVLAAEACKNALAPWLRKKAAEIEAEAQRAREEADAKRRAAEEALRASDAANMAAREEAETLLRDARKAETAANTAARQTPTAGGVLGRAVGLRTTHQHEITDAAAFARWLWLNDRDAMDEFLDERARQLVRAGQRNIPGVTVHDVKVAA